MPRWNRGPGKYLRVAQADKIRPVIPSLIVPLKAALNTRDRDVICVVLKVLNTMVTCVDGAADILARLCA